MKFAIKYSKAIFWLYIFFCMTIYVKAESNETKTVNKSYVSFINEKRDFAISVSGKSIPLVVSSNDFPGVVRVVNDLQNDIFSVTNAKPEISSNAPTSSKEVIIIGTMGKSTLIDKLVKEKKLNSSLLKGKWEKFIITIVDKPLPNVDKALVIAGSDKRGTIYGVYDLSEKIGVSPWYWWADSPIEKHSEIFIKPGEYSNGEPAVKYRGIFLNDEAPALTGWAQEKFGGLNHKFYEKVFELLLRLKANYLWPAMWGNNFDDDDSLNQKLADEYGIVMGTSHHEPMMRSWKEWPKYGHGAWNYQTNDSTLREFWRNGIKRMNDYESIVTLGMRGDGDEAMSQTSNIGLLEKIISDQRKILGEVTHKDVTTIPQVWALYKEVQEYYDKGMRVPDDVTLLLCDDNWGNLRKLPKLNSKPRKGGYGIYYHFDYVGGPRNYKWLNTNQIERVWEQMHLAYEYGVKQIWIVNVGDLKPMEFPISFFIDYACNPNKYNADNLPGYYKDWAKQQFGEKYSNQIAEILELYTKYNARRKPELLSPTTYSSLNYREAETVVTDYNKLADQAEKIYKEISPEYKDAFYQLVLYPVEACANLNDLYVTAAMDHLYAKEGRALTDSLADRVKMLFNKDAELSNYYNKVMANGKWDHMMDQTHIGYTYWQQPDQNNIPIIQRVELPNISDMGVAIEGSPDWWPQDTSRAVLPGYDSITKQTFYVDIFNRGALPFKYQIRSRDPWIKISGPTGTVEKQKRVWISIDWDKIPAGENRGMFGVVGGSGNFVPVAVNANKIESNDVSGFIENDGCVSINADHFSKAVDNSKIKWQVIPNLGRTNSAVTSMPVTAFVENPGDNSPHLEYDVCLFNKGEVKVDAYFSPTLNFFNSQNGIRYAVSFDNEKPQIVNMTPNSYVADLNRDRMWNKWVADNINIEISKHKIETPGRHVLKFWLVDPGVVLQKIVIDAGGVKQSYLGPPESEY